MHRYGYHGASLNTKYNFVFCLPSALLVVKLSNISVQVVLLGCETCLTFSYVQVTSENQYMPRIMCSVKLLKLSMATLTTHHICVM
jgi:hypothetical protein